MRQLVLDTETTGLSVELGHRIIEVGVIELVNRRPTGNHFQRYVNPGREVEAGAVSVHGITNEFLADKPRFADVAAAFVDYVSGAELIIHNAAFDVEFLDQELAFAGLKKLSDYAPVIVDTLAMAREAFPGKRHNLDTLCERFGISHAHRTLHGALLDAELLADFYLAMTRGQESLAISMDSATAGARVVRRVTTERAPLRVLRASDDELAAHAVYLEFLEQETRRTTLWSRLVAEVQAAASAAIPAAAVA